MTDASTPDLDFRAAAEGAVVCRDTGLSAIGIDGEDAAAFLQGQLSNDVDSLDIGKCQWTSYNSAKGRMLANLRLWRESETRFGALIAADLADAMIKRLSLFVLRAKVRLTDQTTRYAVIGVAGPAASDAIRSVFAIAPQADVAIVAGDRHATVIGLGEARFAIAARTESANVIATDLARYASESDGAMWRWGSIRDGVPLITKATSDQFVPQMLNWDALDGISFQKGCYPGQEIVARMRYLGRLKERLYGFCVRSDGAVEPGARIFGAGFGETPCGTVVNSAPAPDGTYALLAVVQVSAVEAGDLTLNAVDGPPLEAFVLPYRVVDAPARAPLR
jgi:tRNA-modifying protein YgfZ